MKWSQIKHAVSKTWDTVKKDPQKTYANIKEFVRKHEAFNRAYQTAKLSLETAIPEVAPIVEGLEAGAKKVDKYLMSEQGGKALKGLANVIDKAVVGNRFI